jgi:hypothetical protein
MFFCLGYGLREVGRVKQRFIQKKKSSATTSTPLQRLCFALPASLRLTLDKKPKIQIFYGLAYALREGQGGL